MAKKLNEQQWTDIKSRYQLGDPIRAIARDYDIPDSTIHAKKNKENWNQNLSAQVSELKNKITEIEHSVEPAQIPLITQRIEADISEHLAIIKSIQNLDKGALSLHNIILKNTISKTKTGEMNEREASGIVAQMGLSVDKVAARAGIGKEQSTTQVNIQNNTTMEIPDNPINASIAYQELIRK